MTNTSPRTVRDKTKQIKKTWQDKEWTDRNGKTKNGQTELATQHQSVDRQPHTVAGRHMHGGTVFTLTK